MSIVDITIPSVGESVTEANIGRFLINSGQWAEKGDPVLEIETDKASMEVNAPESGVIQYKVGEGDLVSIGSVVGSVDTSAKKPAGAKTEAKPKETGSPAKAAAEEKTSATASANNTTQKYSAEQLRGLGPAKRKAAREGKYSVENTSGQSALSTPASTEERQPMSVMRKKIAQRLLQSQHGTASLTTFNEVDMSQVMATRNQLKNDFQNKFGVKLGFMSYFTKAVCYAAAEVPMVTGRIDGEEIVTSKDVNISVAVSTDRGLVVPVLRRANQMNFAQVEGGIGDLAEKARTGKLGIEDMMGGNFTITNGGIFGSLLSTPILNPPQSGILGMHKIEQRPMAIEDGKGGYKIDVRPMMYLALTYDHRLVDGKESVTFLVKVKEFLENVTVDQVMQ